MENYPPIFTFDNRLSDSGLVETIWHTQSSDTGGSFTSMAATHWEMVFTKQYGKTTFTVRGPETKASPAPIPKDAEFLGIIFKLGTFMPHIPASSLVDGAINLPEAADQSFWLQGAAWEIPSFENADTFIHRLVRDSLLAYDPVVEAVLQDQPPPMSVSTVRRRFLQATGLTPKVIQQIDRAHRAAILLGQGVSILDAVFEVGYFDQPHLTRSLKRFMGQTPAQIARLNLPE